jgi:hypothetical protein
MSAEDETQNGYEDGVGGPGAPTSLSALEARFLLLPSQSAFIC